VKKGVFDQKVLFPTDLGLQHFVFPNHHLPYLVDGGLDYLV
jgi:hypothetical protein